MFPERKFHQVYIFLHSCIIEEYTLYVENSSGLLIRHDNFSKTYLPISESFQFFSFRAFSSNISWFICVLTLLCVRGIHPLDIKVVWAKKNRLPYIPNFSVIKFFDLSFWIWIFERGLLDFWIKIFAVGFLNSDLGFIF